MHFHARTHGGLDHAAAFAIGTILIDRVAQAFLSALSRHLHQPQRRNRQDMRFGLVALQPFPHPAVDHLLVLAVLHVDEIADDQTPDIAQPKLARAFVGGYVFGLQTRLLDIAPTFVATRVYIHRNQRFGLFDYNIAAAFEPDLTMKSIVDLLLHAEGLEDRRGAVIKFDSVFRPP